MANFKRVHAEHFDSIDKFLKTIDSRPENTVFQGAKMSSKDHDRTFRGTATYEEAVQLARYGWTEVLSKITERFKASVKNNSNGTITKRRTYNHVVGYAPNVPNAIMGLPQSMINQDKIPQKVKTISIVYAPTGLCDVDADTFINGGVAVLNIVNQLELNGVRVRLMVACKDSEDNSTFTNCTVTIKDYREQLDLKKIAFPMANPSMMRRFGFRWLETLPDLQERGYRSGYGCTISNEQGHKEDLIKHGIIKPTDCFLSLGRIRELNFNIQAIMKDAGIE